MSNYYVYKYVVDNDIIYVGMTNNLIRRIKEHASGTGIESKFTPYLETAKVYYHKCGNATEMKALESLLINHYKPILNIIDVEPGESTVSTDVDWQLYCENEFKEVLDYDLQKYRKLLKSNKTRIANYQSRQEELFATMSSLRPFYSYAASNMDVLARNPYVSLPMPRSYLPKGDAVFVVNRFVSVWYDDQDMQNDVCLVQFSGEFLRELFAVCHQEDWIERTMDMVGNNECRALAAKIANLDATNKRLEQKIFVLQRELDNNA